MTTTTPTTPSNRLVREWKTEDDFMYKGEEVRRVLLLQDGNWDIQLGHVVAFANGNGRCPSVWKCQFSTTSGSPCEVLLEDEVQAAIVAATKRKSSVPLPSELMEHHATILQQRHATASQEYLLQTLLPTWIIQATHELNNEHILHQRYLQLQQQQQQLLYQTTNHHHSNELPPYYTSPPSSYFTNNTNHTASDKSTSTIDTAFSVSCSQLAQRVRTAITTAASMYNDANTTSTTRRSTRNATASSTTTPANPQLAHLIHQQLSSSDPLPPMKITNPPQQFWNPHFAPSSIDIWNQLLHLKKWNSADIQSALLSLVQTDELLCVSGETKKELRLKEPMELARSKFTLPTNTTTSDDTKQTDTTPSTTASKYNTEDKAFHTWRYQGCTNGCTSRWPNWNDYLTQQLQQISSSTEQLQQQQQQVDDLHLAHQLTNTTGSESRRSKRSTKDDSSKSLVYYGPSSSNLTMTVMASTVHRLLRNQRRTTSLVELNNLLFLEDTEDTPSSTARDVKRIRTCLGNLVYKFQKLSRIFLTIPTILPPTITDTNEEKKSEQKKELQDYLEQNVIRTEWALRWLLLKQWQPSPSIISMAGDEKDNATMDVVEEDVTWITSPSHDYLQQTIYRQSQYYIIQDYTPSILLTNNTTNTSSTVVMEPENRMVQRRIRFRAKHKSSEELLILTEAQVMAGVQAHELHQQQQKQQQLSKHLQKHPFDGMVGLRLLLTCSTSGTYHHATLVGLDIRHNQFHILILLDQPDFEEDEMKIDESQEEKEDMKIKIDEKQKVEQETNEEDLPDEVVDKLETEKQEDDIKTVEKKAGDNESNDVKMEESDATNDKDTPNQVKLEEVENEVKLGEETKQMDKDVKMEESEAKETTNDEDNVKSERDEPTTTVEKAESDSKKKDAKELSVWAIVSPDGAEMELSEANDSILGPSKKFKLEGQEYHPSSPAFQACESLLDFLKSHNKSGPFMEPVDPIALNIPDYPTVIKHPMDLSTVEQKLHSGLYGRIPPTDRNANTSAIRKMVGQGPFYYDVMLIFDNAMAYNNPGDWIHNDALQLKRIVAKKIETIIAKTESQQGIQLSSKDNHPKKQSKKKSIYVDEDSDEEYEYNESDEYDDHYDDDDYGKSKRKRKRTSNYTNGSTSEDFSTQAIEAPFHIPSNVNDILPLSTEASKFTLPKEWSCRHSSSNKDNTTSADVQQQEQDELAMLELQLNQDKIIRRSARSSTSTRNSNPPSSSNKTMNMGTNLKNMLYYLVTNDDENDEVVASDRVEVEKRREERHEEYYAKMYYKLFVESSSKGTSLVEPIMFANSSFPPYLGRVVPTGCTGNDEECHQVGPGLKWEIRSPFVMPALQWIMRGLIHSGHLSKLSSSDELYVVNHAYYYDAHVPLFDVLDVKEIQKQQRQQRNNEQEEEEEEEEVELSAYEKMRAERVQRNKERLKALGLV